MIRFRTAAALTAGTVAALAVGGAAFASDRDDAMPMTPNGDVIAVPATTEPAPSPSESSSAGSDDTAGTAGPDSSPSAGTGVGTAPSGTASQGAAPSGAASQGGAASGATPSGAAQGGVISLDRARTIALQAAGGGRVEDVERETERGRAVWDVEIRNGAVEHDIDVDRATGEIVRHERDTDDDNGRDDRDDADDRDDRGDRDDRDDADDRDDRHGDDRHGDDRHGDDRHGDSDDRDDDRDGDDD